MRKTIAIAALTVSVAVGSQAILAQAAGQTGEANQDPEAMTSEVEIGRADTQDGQLEPGGGARSPEGYPDPQRPATPEELRSFDPEGTSPESGGSAPAMERPGFSRPDVMEEEAQSLDRQEEGQAQRGAAEEPNSQAQEQWNGSPDQQRTPEKPVQDWQQFRESHDPAMVREPQQGQ